VNKDVDLWDGVSGQEHYQPAAWIELPTTGGAHAGQRRPVEARELQLAQAGGEVVVEAKVITSILWAAQIYTSPVFCFFPHQYCPGALFILPQKQLRVYRKCTFYI
jgi:hypothetical protein